MIKQKSATATYPTLTPLKSEWMDDLVQSKEELFDLFNRFPSPVNIHYLAPFKDNFEDFQRVFKKHDLKHQIYFARKANKCQAFVWEAKRLGFGVDTASFRELQQCLEVGCDPKKLVSTAAIKGTALIELALKNEVPIMIDNEDECALINELAGELGKTPEIGIRISGFYFKGEKLYSRFGFDVDKVVDFIKENIGQNKRYDKLKFRGFHFHLNGYSMQQRSVALLQTIECAEALAKFGFMTNFIDMGGGILMNYLKNEEEWNVFMEALQDAVQGFKRPITFQNNGLGYQVLHGELEGKASVYPYFNKTPRSHFLDRVLYYENKKGQSVANLLKEKDIEIRIEPGRSMLDQTGMTVAKVAFRKYDSNGDLLIGLEMNRTQMFSSSADFLLDPIVLNKEENTSEESPTSAYFVGAYCLEQDLLLKRKINLKRVPDIGDMVCFFNTAGYMMHFYESEAHLFDLASNVVAVKENDKKQFNFVKDEEFSYANK